MKTVDAIIDLDQLKNMKSFLKLKSSRDYCLFLMGINTGIKLQDLLHLHVKDVCNENGDVCEFLRSPLYSVPRVFFNKHIQNSLQLLITESQLKMDDFLFKSRKTNEPITRQQAYRIINEAAKHAGVEGSVGTHTLRKTFAYHAIKQGIAISFVQKRLHHANSSETIHYLGLSSIHEIEIILDINL